MGDVMMNIVLGIFPESQQEDVSIFNSMNVVYHQSMCHCILWMIEIFI